MKGKETEQKQQQNCQPPKQSFLFLDFPLHFFNVKRYLFEVANRPKYSDAK
jgi:hypothetical protein